MNTVYQIMYIFIGVLAGAIAALKWIAPRTMTTVDDSVLARLEDVEAFVQKVLPYLPQIKGSSTPPDGQVPPQG